MDELLQVSLAPARRSASSSPPCRRLLRKSGAAVILGGQDQQALATPITPAADTLFGPRGVCAASDGSVWVSDSGHHRVLAWRRAPARDREPADLILGQPGFDREGRNARGSVSAVTLNRPSATSAWAT